MKTKLMKTKLEQLEQLFLEAKAHGNQVYVAIDTSGTEEPELIISHTSSIDNKLAYYKKAYNEDLVLKSFDGTRILEAGRILIEEVNGSTMNLTLTILDYISFKQEGLNESQ